MDWNEVDAVLQGRHEDGAYRRIEVITGNRRRRNWSAQEKARIVAESAAPGVLIADVARRWGMNRGLLTIWRRQAGLVRAKTAREATTGLRFVPIAFADEDRSAGRDPDSTASVPAGSADAGRIEVETGGSRMVVTGRVDPSLAAAMVAALRGAR